MAMGFAGVGHWQGWKVLARVVPCPFLGCRGYLGMRPCEKKLKCWLLPMMM